MPVDLQEARLVEGFETVLENIHALQSASLQSWASDLLSHSEQLCSGLLEYLKSTTLSDEKSSWGNSRAISVGMKLLPVDDGALKLILNCESSV